MRKQKGMKNKKNLTAVALLAGIGVIIGAGAFYAATESDIHNHSYQGEKFAYKLTYDSKSDVIRWTTDEEKDFIASLENTGDIDFAVRFKVNEKWVNVADDSVVDPDGGDAKAALYDNVMFVVDDTKWDLKADGYYYYKSTVAPTDTIDKFIDHLVNDTTNLGDYATRTNTYDTEGEAVNSVITYSDGDQVKYVPTIDVDIVQVGYDWNA